jgi:hypothetical protein
MRISTQTMSRTAKNRRKGLIPSRTRLQIDLDPETLRAVEERAFSYGMMRKPFIEMVLEILAGTKKAPDPDAAVVRIPNMSAPKRGRPRPSGFNARPRPPLRNPPPPQEDTADIDRDPNRYRTLVAPRIFSDGTNFRLNNFGTVTYHRTLEAAVAERDRQPPK